MIFEPVFGMTPLVQVIRQQHRYICADVVQLPLIRNQACSSANHSGQHPGTPELHPVHRLVSNNTCTLRMCETHYVGCPIVQLSVFVTCLWSLSSAMIY
jgi:hypothetical protein